MPIRARLVAIVESMVQKKIGQYDLIGVHYVRRVATFPAAASLYLVVDILLDGTDAKGKQIVTVEAQVPGQSKPATYTATFDFGNPADATRGVQLPIPLNLTFERPGTWRFSVWHNGAVWGRLNYLVVEESVAAAVGRELAAEHRSLDDKTFAQIEEKLRRRSKGK